MQLSNNHGSETLAGADGGAGGAGGAGDGPSKYLGVHNT